MQDHTGGNGKANVAAIADEQRKEALALALKEFTSEMKLVDVVDLVAFVRTEQHGNIADLIRSSAELYFKEDTLRYGMAASVDLDWDRPPTIGMDLEFYHKGVWVYFSLVLGEPENAVNVSYIEFTNASDDPEENTRRLLEALDDARAQARGQAS
jgi:hypothetical protein